MEFIVKPWGRTERKFSDELSEKFSSELKRKFSGELGKIQR
jgi:hypothetical protein